MGIFTPLTSPRDPRWQGIQHHHHTIFLVKNLILLLFIIFIIIEYSLFRSWWNRESSTSIDYAPYSFGLRIAFALIPDLVYTIFALVLIFQKPTLSLKDRTWTFHPAFALTFSIIMFGLYVGATFVNVLVIASNEVSFYNMNTWDSIGYAEAGVQGVLGLCYLGLTVCACVAVHRWRIGQEGSKGFVEVDNRMETGMSNV
ncbi:uncharacterized protein K460DRAFT_387518 [Cucurbitaria berberidis CBS 394.84]|uniref:MARVEL domain-containing protein n=1 Tax=Cucurbitaria berberidis CBS 394.84 TaxID=1168544 RepID=A0A9P4L6J8_9PLEO|nr:uncharacterized protein K460DRAFT_387518 [Cucurbitaria berberidis CBS 394.84]KAF1843442.1 hypothetical protein K460DRAFT_387518 [Cucurbitaria berberidis CBS 394.84]